jgi:hypothetical protein
MPDFIPNVTKQNVTELLYKASLINNTDLQESVALTNLVVGVTENGGGTGYTSTVGIQNDLNIGQITLDTYVLVEGPAFAPRERFVDTAGNILAQY